jgi:hypothetical protein
MPASNRTFAKPSALGALCAAVLAPLFLTAGARAQSSPPPANPAQTPTPTPETNAGTENETAAEDAALEDDAAQSMQKAPETEEDEVFRTATTPGPDAPARVNYELALPKPERAPCARTIRAHVVALDQVFFWNRLGAVQPHGMIFALRHQVVPTHAGTVRKPLVTGRVCEPRPGRVTTFREFVIQYQNDLNLRFGDRSPVPNLAEAEDPEDSGQKAFNYRTEPFWTRLCYWPSLQLTGAPNWPPASQCPQSNARATRQLDMTNSLHNTQIGGRDPVTPVFTARAGQPTRLRVLHSGGHARNDTFMLHGHIWQEMPYQSGTASAVIGENVRSPWHGAQWGHGPSNHFDVVLDGAGGDFRVAGDYLYRTFESFNFDGGMWGLFRVSAPAAAPATRRTTRRPRR